VADTVVSALCFYITGNSFNPHSKLMKEEKLLFPLSIQGNQDIKKLSNLCNVTLSVSYRAEM
jgi:hypothetical protein